MVAVGTAVARRGPVWLATPSPYGTFIHNTSPAWPAHKRNDLFFDSKRSIDWKDHHRATRVCRAKLSRRVARQESDISKGSSPKSNADRTGLLHATYNHGACNRLVQNLVRFGASGGRQHFISLATKSRRIVRSAAAGSWKTSPRGGLPDRSLSIRSAPPEIGAVQVALRIYSGGLSSFYIRSGPVRLTHSLQSFVFLIASRPGRAKN